jgi:hypothetical protein
VEKYVDDVVTAHDCGDCRFESSSRALVHLSGVLSGLLAEHGVAHSS